MGANAPVARVTATDAALGAVRLLRARRGPVMLFQSGGCCDGSLPICLDEGELVTGEGDVYLGEIEGAGVWIDARQFEVWKGTQLVLDVEPGLPEGFSLPAGDDGHFVTRSRRFSAEELAALAAARPPEGRDTRGR